MKMLKVIYYKQGEANNGYLHSFVNFNDNLNAVILKEDGTIIQHDYKYVKVGDLVSVNNS